MKLFADLVQRSGGNAVRRLWPKLDREARWYVMHQLGCFAGPASPQRHDLRHFEQRRAVIGEMNRQIRMLKKSIVVVQSFVAKSKEFNFVFYEYGWLSQALTATVKRLEHVKAVSSKYFGGPYDREIRSIVEAREFVQRRTSFLGKRATLSAAAIADIFELNERGLKKPSSKDIAARVQKALVRFCRGSEYDRYMSEMGTLIPDWRRPDPRQKADIQTPKSRR